ncbi:MAG: carbohydrate deacetylase [Myxococcota bacterium]
MRVIVNADDLGLSGRVNDAIARCVDAGVVTSVSVLARAPLFGEAVAMLRARPDVSVGVHLDLTEFSSLGRFAPAARVAAEWRDQLARVRDAGLDVTHLDSHQHVHWRYPAVIAGLGVRRVRGMTGVRTDRAVGPVRAWIQATRARMFRARLRALGASTTDAFGSVAVLRALARPVATFEAMAHPGADEEETAFLLGGGLAGVSLIGWRDL